MKFSRWRPSAILNFQKFIILTARTLRGAKCVTMPNFVQIGNRCRDMAVFVFSRWRPSAILDFQKLEILISRTLLRVKMRHRTKFYADQSNRCRDMAVYNFSRWRPSAILDFQKFVILTACTLRGAKCVTMPNFVQIGQGVAEIWPFLICQDGGRPPSWICYTRVWTTHEVYFGGLCHCAKFGLNRFSSFDNMQVLIF